MFSSIKSSPRKGERSVSSLHLERFSAASGAPVSGERSMTFVSLRSSASRPSSRTVRRFSSGFSAETGRSLSRASQYSTSSFFSSPSSRATGISSAAGRCCSLHGEVELREAFAGELALGVRLRREQFVAELRRRLGTRETGLHAQGFAVDRGGFGELELALKQVALRHEILRHVGPQLHGVVELFDGLVELLLRRQRARLLGKGRGGRAQFIERGHGLLFRRPGSCRLTLRPRPPATRWPRCRRRATPRCAAPAVNASF